jgi:endogenous inhibitor of DNA gyrase (YacG/DUF329 family)
MNCPICKKLVADEGPDKPLSYPFCSQRCRLIDLGRWLGEKYQIRISTTDADSMERNPQDKGS